MMNEFEDKDRKEFRRKKLQKNRDLPKIDHNDEYKKAKKNKKALRSKIEELQEEELWGDWEDIQ